MSSTASAPIVIIGTGLSGYSLVRELRKQDKDTPVMLITADDGRSYSKPMLSTGLTRQKTADELAQADAGKMAEQFNVDVRTFTTVTGLDTERKEVLIGEERQPYEKLVLAWGADVIRLDLAGDGLDKVYSINDLMDYGQFREALDSASRVAILGAGLIGCEFANDLRNGGYEVDVIAPSDTTLPGLVPPEAGRAIQNALTESGVRFHLETVAECIDSHGDGVRLQLANGEQLEADLVISAVGLRPRTQLAEQAGLEVHRGITVNRALETSAPDVYALGDCAEVDGHLLLYVLPLMASARALAKTLTGERTEVRYGAMPVVIKTPCCPTAVCPPPNGAEGEWRIESEGHDTKALFCDPQGQVLGFAVTGEYAAEKQTLAKEVPPLHD
ncbi:FAD-dependent oxidoreductase [Marinobacteraceae bacterium S3BR75-40.1]